VGRVSTVTSLTYRVPRIVNDYFDACERADSVLPASPAVLAAVVLIDGRRVRFGDLTPADLRRMAELEAGT
jgi:hypothetical protein